MATEDEAAKEPWKFRTDFMRLRRYSFIPGYTGHCPTLRERFGETYATATCAANTIRRRSASMPAFELADMSSTGTEDSSIMTEIVPLTRRGLEYPSYKPPPYLSQPPRPGRRHTFETPLIGYQGHIPRLRTTHVGLGMRFTEAARHSLHAFRQELEHERRYREKLREACYAT